MPVLKPDIPFPAWCTLEHYEFVNLERGEQHSFMRRGAREKLIVLSGRCRLGLSDDTSLHEVGSTGARHTLDDADGTFHVSHVGEPARLLRVCGHWGPGCDTFGLFTPAGRTPPRAPGDPCDYPKTNDMDRHYHDCDEYWFIVEGRGRAMSEGVLYDVGPGDCVATGMGHHHDFPEDVEPVRAVYLETDLEGQKRRGHLWEYRHGKAQPQAERV